MKNRIVQNSDTYNRPPLLILLDAADWLSSWYWDQDAGRWATKADKDAYAILCEIIAAEILGVPRKAVRPIAGKQLELEAM